MDSILAAEAYQSKTRETRRPQSAVGTRAIHFEVPIPRKPSIGRVPGSSREIEEDGSVDDFIQDDSPIHSDRDVDDTIDKLYKEHKHTQFIRSLEHSPVSDSSAPARRNRPGSPHSSKSRDAGGYMSSSSGDYEYQRIDYVPDKSKLAGHDSKEENLYKYISNLMTDKPGKPKRASSASMSRPLSGKAVTEDSSIQSLTSAKTSTITAGLSRRPVSATTTRSRPASGYTYKSGASKVTDSPAIGSIVTEITSLEAKIYESNSQKKIREANEFSKDLNLKCTWELTARATSQTPYRVILKSNGKFIKEMSMDMFNREFRKLQRDRQEMFRERKNKVMEGQFRALFDRDPEENARETRSTIKELLLETMQLISKLQEQTELIRRKNESKFPRGGIFLNS